MDILTLSSPRARVRRIAVADIVLAATLLAGPGIAAVNGADGTPDVVVKAALLYNFAKFTEWPGMAASDTIVFCVVADDGIAEALVETVTGKSIGGHKIQVSRPQVRAEWRTCNLLYIPDAEARRSGSGLDGLKTLPVLTVSDGKGFGEGGGIIELYIDSGRMRFAINVDAAESSGLRLSSRLLGLARITRNAHVQ